MKTCTECLRTYADDIAFCPHDATRLTAMAAAEEAQLAAGFSRRFRMVRRLGEGGMGTVYLAEQISVGNRPVALKVLSRRLLDDPQFLLRFQDEAASTGRIRHANVVTIYESGQADDGTPYIAMEFLEGESLGEAIKRRGALPVAECTEILQQTARGLNAAHKLGIIHRDLKPDNIFLTQGDEGELIVKVVDFGIAKLRESAMHTMTGMVLGTPAYMSHEQASGMRSDQLDLRSDVYSLGVVVYEMLSGRVPFHSDTPLGYLRKHMMEDPPSFGALVPHLAISPQIEAVVMKALAKDRDQRFTSALEFAREFSRAATAPAPSEALPQTVLVERVQTEQERQVPEKAEAERREQEKAEAERLLRERAEKERLAREKAEADRRQAEKAEAERLARERAEQERQAREKAEAERLEREKAEAERLAREIAQRERQAREKAEAELREKERAEVRRLAQEKTEQRREAADKMEAVWPEKERTQPASRVKRLILALVSASIIVAGIWYLARREIQPWLDQRHTTGRMTPIEKSAPAVIETKLNPKDALKYVWIPPGTFTMGCSPGDTDCWGDTELPHQVTITKGFWIGQTPVTVGAYRRFAEATGRQMPAVPRFSSGWTNENMPIVNASWNDAKTYCEWMGGRLPTEAEWEYAARGGSTEARYGNMDDIAWYTANSGGQTHEVAQKQANAFGLFDMLGNVWEWVNDWYDADYYQKSPSQDPTGPARGESRVLRGASWYGSPIYVRASRRGIYHYAHNVDGVGFRCVGEVISP